MHNAQGQHKLIKISLKIAATQPVAWPHFAGSTLRGAFGRALREAACVTRQPRCDGCALRLHCSYGVVFDPLPPVQPLHPSFRNGLPLYVVQPPAMGACRLDAGMEQAFSILFFPGSNQHLGLLPLVLQRTVAQQLNRPGLYKLISTSKEEISIEPVSTTPTQPTADQSATQLTLRWRTPFRVQQNGSPISNPQALDAKVFVRALLRRQMQWCQITCQPPPEPEPLLQAATHCRLDANNLHWHDMQRRNSILNEKIPLSGLVGAATLHGPKWAISSLMPLLKLAEQIHVGKETVMGLGQFAASQPEPG